MARSVVMQGLAPTPCLKVRRTSTTPAHDAGWGLINWASEQSVCVEGRQLAAANERETGPRTAALFTRSRLSSVPKIWAGTSKVLMARYRKYSVTSC